ncbi:ssDNA endonuclease and repair protein rad10 [Varicellaria rhodocarpa]|nr:ssDNA endonuclease and repair protein rad10 [Varicellaria rhodocarpa]
MDDDFGDDQDFAAIAEAVERSYNPQASSFTTTATAVAAPAPKVQQPKPQALPSRNAPSSILVSPRQKGNPILNNIRSLPWEYSDIPPDFVLGATTCALFLSLKYHRLHPEYIYSRIRALQGKYNLRILLTMVDIQNHEESLKELSKTSLVNNLTLILCWSAQEAGKYLELYKSYEHASPTSIRAHQSTTYAEKLVEFITVPRSINKTDAVGLVSAFGSVRAAVNARPEEIGMITGWGEKKVQRWCKTVREPFRVRKAAKKGIENRREESSVAELSRDNSMFNEDEPDNAQTTAHQGAGVPIPINRMPSREASALARSTLDKSATPDAERRPPKRAAEDVPLWEPGKDEEEALLLAAAEQDNVDNNSLTPVTKSLPTTAPKKQPSKEAELTDSMAAALARLRNK